MSFWNGFKDGISLANSRFLSSTGKMVFGLSLFVGGGVAAGVTIAAIIGAGLGAAMATGGIAVAAVLGTLAAGTLIYYVATGIVEGVREVRHDREVARGQAAAQTQTTERANETQVRFVNEPQQPLLNFEAMGGNRTTAGSMMSFENSTNPSSVLSAGKSNHEVNDIKRSITLPTGDLFTIEGDPKFILNKTTTDSINNLYEFDNAAVIISTKPVVGGQEKGFLIFPKDASIPAPSYKITHQTAGGTVNKIESNIRFDNSNIGGSEVIHKLQANVFNTRTL